MGVTMKFQFLAGRYHATPWDRNVNEGEVEWPPSPWRLLRAFMATWHLKVDPEQFSEPLLRTLIGKLAGTYPLYHLPQATRFHTRHYMPTGTLSGGNERRVLLLDTFLRVDAPLVVHWPEVDLSNDEHALLKVLLERIGYLGRAESWVSAALAKEWSGSFNCYASEQSVDEETGDLLEPVRLAVPKGAEAYSEWRTRMIAEYGLDKARLSQRERRLLETLPESLIDALQLDTGAVRAQRWSRMPGMDFATFQRSPDCFVAKPATWLRTTGRDPEERMTSVRLVLAGKPLPRLEDAVRVGEAVRDAVVSRARRLSRDGSVPWVISGRNIPEGHTHAHAYYLPEDADGDGRIDHVLVYAAAGLDWDTVRILGSVRNVKFRHRRHEDGWDVVLEGFGENPVKIGTMYAGASTTWTSVTPYLRPWHSKRNFGLHEQLVRECSLMELPKLQELHVKSTLTLRGRHVRPAHFHRFRSKHGLNQPDTQGAFVRLRFSEPVEGPLALGFGSHFGLGMFRPEDS